MEHSYEEHIISVVKPYMLSCRPGDWEHVQRVARWVKVIAARQPGLILLIVAAYVHDIGWFKIVPSDSLITKEILKSLEPEANKQSDQLVFEVLDQLNIFDESDRDTVLRLVHAADKHLSSREDEAFIVDADNLSKLDINHVREKYQKEEWSKMIALWEEVFPERIQTAAGKEKYPEMLMQLKKDAGLLS